MGLLHGDAAWDYGVGLTGIARDVYGSGPSASREKSGEEWDEILEKRKDRYEQFLEMIKEKENLFAEIDGEIKVFSIKIPKKDWRGEFSPTMGKEDLSIFSEKICVEYANSVEYGSLYRKYGSNDPYKKMRDILFLLFEEECELEKERVRQRCKMEIVDGLEVPTFVSIYHPDHYGISWALLDNMCYPIKSKHNNCRKLEYVLDESRSSISLDDLYSLKSISDKKFWIIYGY